MEIKIIFSLFARICKPNNHSMCFGRRTLNSYWIVNFYWISSLNLICERLRWFFSFYVCFNVGLIFFSLSFHYSKLLRKYYQQLDGGSCGKNGNVLLHDSSTDPLAKNSQTISTDEVCSNCTSIEICNIATISFALFFGWFIYLGLKPIFKFQNEIRKIKHQMGHWNSQTQNGQRLFGKESGFHNKN